MQQSATPVRRSADALGAIEAISGVRMRRVAEVGVQCSDLAADAGRRALSAAGLAPGDVDLLLFAAAGQDLIEPATAHIVQQKLASAVRCSTSRTPLE